MAGSRGPVAGGVRHVGAGTDARGLDAAADEDGEGGEAADDYCCGDGLVSAVGYNLRAASLLRGGFRKGLLAAERGARERRGTAAHVPTRPSMAAHNISHVVLTCPPFTLELRETQRTIAQTMVTTPTMKMTAMLNFSTSDIRSVKSTRSGMAITAEGQQSSMLNPLNTVEEQKTRQRECGLIKSVKTSTARQYHRLIAFARASLSVRHSPISVQS